ncbi:MAG TPA: DUF692 family protein [Candidatus Solibacter sp.]|nr:DUF692 family protein [Candidatus Solibacter sp.]
MRRKLNDRFGLSWRPELAAGILAHLDRIDVVEVIADDYFDAPRRRLDLLRTLSGCAPVILHGVTQGLASTARADERRLAKMARLFEAVRPDGWSEHLAFVRGGGIEIGHLAAPPRNAATVEGTLRNLERAQRTVGTAPSVENIATLIDPPGSSMSEAAWIGQILAGTDSGLLLDLHNLHANAANFGYEPVRFLDEIDCSRVSTVHLAGGRMLPRGRLLDDHLHDVPDEVYGLLAELAARVSGPLTVVLERDGNYPAIGDLLAQLDLAREAVAVGRRRQAA